MGEESLEGPRDVVDAARERRGKRERGDGGYQQQRLSTAIICFMLGVVGEIQVRGEGAHTCHGGRNEPLHYPCQQGQGQSRKPELQKQ